MVQNLAWATGYNLIAVPLAAGVLAGAGVITGPGRRRDPDERLDPRCGRERAAICGGPTLATQRQLTPRQGPALASGAASV